jgi:septal ring factor EnvC (AmiA/AmiB activator)
LSFGERLRQHPLSETLMNPEWPNLFDYGDGMRELTYALENIAKCANGLHCLALHERGISIRWDLIHNTFRFQHETITHDLRLAQSRVERLCQDIDRVRADQQSSARDLHDRTAELDRVRQELHDRTAELDRDRHALRERGEQVEQARQEAARQALLTQHLQQQLQQTIAEPGDFKFTKKATPVGATL